MSELPATVEDALARTWAAELLEGASDVQPHETLRPPDAQAPDTLDETTLPRIELAGSTADLELRDILGEGGMAIVSRAWQRSLGRDVAVKRSRDSLPRTRTTMVREARIAGALEHPNIVPIHALGNDGGGDAVIVMRRVSGASWAEALSNPEHPVWGEGDRLQRNLEILSQVCHALELAHARGWLHRDLKTANVMLGEFGEVYVVDWGIAVPIAVADRGEASFAGTPAYMSPEMAAAGVLTPRTDVFLLGAMLHEVLTGEAVNQADTLREILACALLERTRRYPPGVPQELAQIATRATAYHAADRYPDVASFRRALADFVVHRDSLEIAERTAARVESVEHGVPGERAELVDARGAYGQALMLWDENPRAREGLDHCLRRLVERELADDNPSAAAGWLAQLDPPDAELEERVQEARRAAEQRARELESLRDFAADRDIMVAWRARRTRALVYAAAVVLLGVGSGVALRAGWFELGYVELMVLLVASGVAGIASAVLGSQRWNLLNRSVSRVMVLGTLTPFVALAATYRLDLPAETALAIDSLLKAAGTSVLALLVQPLFGWVALANLATAVLLLAAPGTYPLEITAGGLAVALLIVALNLRPAPDAQAPAEPSE